MRKIMRKENISQTIDNIETKIESYLSLKDDLGISSIMEVLDDSLSIFRGLNSLTVYISKKRFAYFLKGLSKDNVNIDMAMKQLYSYIDNENKAEVISKIIDKVIKSNSKNAAFLLGLISSDIIVDKVEVDYRYIICISALGELYDFDLNNLEIVWEYLEDNNARPRPSDWFTVGRWMKEWGKSKNYIIDQSIELTIEKCYALQLIIKAFESDIDINDDNPSDATVETSELYKFADAGKLLEHYYKSVKRLRT